MKKIGLFVMIFVLSFSFFAGSPLLTMFAQKAHATSDDYVVKRELIAASITASDFENYYGGTNSELSLFTPFDYESETRMAGKSIDLPHDENNTVQKTYTLPLGNGVEIDNRAGIGLWIFFSGTEVHDFTIKLEIDASNYFEKTINKGELVGLLSKDYDEEGFGWNYFVIPMYDSNVTGTIMSGNSTLDFSQITITYDSSVIEDKSYSSIKIYDVVIVDTVLDNLTVEEKQDYAVYKFNFWDDDLLSALIVNDSLSIKTLPNAVSYAWVGELNLLAGGTISWQVLVRKPGSNQALSYNFGENFTLDKEGEYYVSYRASNVGGEAKLYLIDTISFMVSSNMLLSFVFQNYKLESGKSKLISLYPSSMLNMETASIVSIEFDDSVIDIEGTENFCEFIVTGKNSGETTVTIKIQVKRNTNSSVFEIYEASTSVKCIAQEDNSMLQTILLVSLGVILCISLIFGIKTLVKSRKLVVK